MLSEIGVFLQVFFFFIYKGCKIRRGIVIKIVYTSLSVFDGCKSKVVYLWNCPYKYTHLYTIQMAHSITRFV